MSDVFAETPEETAQLEAIKNEQEYELTPEEKGEQKAEEKPAEQGVKAEEKPEPKVEEKPEEKKPVRLVPHQALNEERERNKALLARLAELEKPKETQQDIDEHQDPLGAIGDLRKRLAAYEEREQQQRQAHQMEQELVARITPRINAYKAEHPEYPEQVKYLQQSRLTELTLLGMPEQQAAQQIAQEERALAIQAIQNDLDMGAMVAGLAKHRGWQPKEEPKKEEVKPNKEAEQKLERLQKGQKAAISPSKGGGEGAESEMTLDHLLSLSGAAFDKAFEKHGKRLMGG